MSPHEVVLAGRRFRIRPVTAADEPAMIRLLQRSTPEEIRLRFFRFIRCIGHALAAPLVRPDDAAHVGIVAVDADGAPDELAATAMLVIESAQAAEYAILVHHDYTQRGLGRHLLECLLAEARRRGVRKVWGLVLRENEPMLQLAREMGWLLRADPDERECLRVECQA